MSENRNRGASREKHEHAAEMHDGAAHAHLVASVAHEKQDHLTAHESSRYALENTLGAQAHSRQASEEFGHSEIAAAAHLLWEDRGRPPGSAEQDWFDAVRDLREEHVVSVLHGAVGMRKGGVRKNV